MFIGLKSHPKTGRYLTEGSLLRHWEWEGERKWGTIWDGKPILDPIEAIISHETIHDVITRIHGHCKTKKEFLRSASHKLDSLGGGQYQMSGLPEEVFLKIRKKELFD